MATEAALAKAKEIAMRLAGGINSDLGKRKNRWDEDQGGVGMKQSRKIYVPVKEHPEINYLGLLIGPQGSTQKQLSASTGARIVIRGRGSSKDGRNSGDPDENDDLHVYIEGTEEAVQKAYNEIHSIFNDPESANRLKAQQLSQLSGGGGGGSSSMMSHSHDSIYGGGGGGGGVGHSSDSYQIELRIPNSMVGLIIGKGGENIVRIQTQLGVHAQIAKEHEMPPGDTHRSIVLKGSPGAVAEAKNRIEDLISSQATRGGGGGGSSSGGQQMNSSGMRDLDNSFIVKLPVPNDKVGIIIGKGGITVRGIQERTGANIQIPPNPDEDNPQVRTLNIGAESKEAVDAAQMEIFMALQMQQQQSQQAYNSVSNNFTFPIPDDKVGIVIGKSGVTVKDLQNRLRVKIQIPQMPDPGSNPPVRTLSVAGPPDMQMMAKYEIEMMLVGTPIPGTVAAAGSAGITAVSNGYGMYGSQMGQYGGGGGMYPQQQLQQYGYYGMPPQAPANMYGMQYPTQQAAVYGGYPYDPSASMNPYGQQHQLQAPYPTQQPAAPAAPEEIPSDPTAYYNDYWHYASYYGEAAARLYYGAWSPPEGTPPPPGVVVVAEPPTSAASDTTQSDGAVYSESQQQQQQDYATSQAAVPTTAAAATAATVVSAEDTTSSVSSSDNAAADSDPNAAALAWDKYKKEYADWYEAYGKATGADPNPPDM